MRVGKTIGAKREQAQSESERMVHREKVKRRKFISVATYIAVLLLVGVSAVSILKGMRKEESGSVDPFSGSSEPTVEIIDEASVGVPKKAREFVGNLEQDLNEYKIKLLKAVLPRDKTREVDVYIADFDGYFKLSLDRGAGVSAEDLERMVRYLRGLGFSGVEYVDLRVEGKGYYKGAKTAEEPKPEEKTEGGTEVVTEVETGVEPEDGTSSVFVREGESSEGISEEVYSYFEGDYGEETEGEL